MSAILPDIAPASEHHTVVIVGGGQAGLSISWYLTQQRIDHLILEAHTVAHEWHDGRWDNFTLVTPNWQCRLPGHPYAGDDPDGFMPRDEVHAFVSDYARSFGAPVREHTVVASLQQLGDGYLLTTSGPDGEATVSADQVVVATGGYHLPIVPPAAERLPDHVVQLHSSQYKNPAQLPDGAVLVVGSGQSGAQIAEDLHLEGRPVILAVGSAPRVARFYRGRDCVAWLDDMGHYDRPVGDHPLGLATKDKTNHYVTGRDGGRDIDLRAFALEGMRLRGRLTDIRGNQVSFAPTLERALDAADAVAEGIKDAIDRHIDAHGLQVPEQARYRPVWRPEAEQTSLDLSESNVSAVIWCNGYRADYRWIQVGVFDGLGYPRHVRGVTGVPGLYFLGLPWLHTWGSGRFGGVAKDAEFLASTISERVFASSDAA